MTSRESCPLFAILLKTYRVLWIKFLLYIHLSNSSSEIACKIIPGFSQTLMETVMRETSPNWCQGKERKKDS